jgi:hypothetical protein
VQCGRTSDLPDLPCSFPFHGCRDLDARNEELHLEFKALQEELHAVLQARAEELEERGRIQQEQEEQEQQQEEAREPEGERAGLFSPSRDDPPRTGSLSCSLFTHSLFLSLTRTQPPSQARVRSSF